MKIKLNKSAKELIKRRLIEYIDMSEAGKVEIHPVVQKWTFVSRFIKFAPAFAVVAVVVLVGGGVSFAAQRSFPGDALYPVKINFNEKIVSLLQTSSKSKVHYEIKLAMRRLDEAAELAVKGKIGEKEERILASGFQTHVENTEASLKNLEEDNGVEDAAREVSNFEGSLRARGEILSKLEEKNSRVKGLKNSVRSAIGNAENARGGFEARVAAAASGTIDENRNAENMAGKSSDNASDTVSSVRLYIKDLKKKIGKGVSSRVEKKIKDAEDLVDRSRSKIKEGSFGEAFGLGVDAARTAQEARALTDIAPKLGSDFDIQEDNHAENGNVSTSTIDGDRRGSRNEESGDSGSESED